jgi:hypothetical protein
MGLQTTLIGYSEHQDKVIQYSANLRVRGENRRTRIISNWVDYLFSIEPCASGFWRYEIDYRGRGGSLDTYQIKYNPRREQFEGLYVRTNKRSKHPTYYSAPRRCLTSHSTGAE